jgi:YVTN family beta-propeller protein
VIDTATNTVMTTVPVGSFPFVGVAITPDGTHAYVANGGSNNVSVIATATNTLVATLAVGSGPSGVAVTPDGAHVYVANRVPNNVSVIDTATNTVEAATIPVGNLPIGVGIGIIPPAAGACLAQSSIPANFNATQINAGSFIWFNANFKKQKASRARERQFSSRTP